MAVTSQSRDVRARLIQQFIIDLPKIVYNQYRIPVVVKMKAHNKASQQDEATSPDNRMNTAKTIIEYCCARATRFLHSL
jgi:hypothetical protein